METTTNKKQLFTYLDKVMGRDGIKTSNKIEIKIDQPTAITLLALGVGLVVFNHLLRIGIDSIRGKP